MSLRDRALLVRLSVSRWCGRRKDVNAARTVTDAAEAKREAVNVTKSLIDGPSFRRVQTLAATLRNFHYDQTLPWEDGGRRLIPTAKFDSYWSEIEKIREQFNLAVDAFLKTYGVLKIQARSNLGTLFDEQDYPPVTVLRNKFRVGVVAYEMPSEDIRVTASAQALERIRKDLADEADRATVLATKDLYKRALGLVDRMAETLGNPNAVFRDTLVNNLISFLDFLPDFNDLFSESDPELVRLHERLKALVIEPDTLRTDPAARTATAKAAGHLAGDVSRILSNMDF